MVLEVSNLDDPFSLTQAEAAPGDGEVWLAAQMEAFQAAVRGAPLDVALSILTRTASKQWDNGVRCAFYMVNRDGTELHHVSGMAESYAECVDGFKVGRTRSRAAWLCTPDAPLSRPTF